MSFITSIIFNEIVSAGDGDGDGMADSYISVNRYTGGTTAVVEGEVSLGVNDIDTVVYTLEDKATS